MTNADIQIRSVTHPEVPAIASLAREIWQATYPEIITQAQIDFMLEQRYGHERLYDDIEQADKWLDQAFLDGKRVGFCACELRKNAYRMDKLYIHPEVQRRGVGGAMIAHAAERGRRMGFERILLQVNKRNEKAINSYRKYGFVICEDSLADIGGGFFMDDHIMEKKL